MGEARKTCNIQIYQFSIITPKNHYYQLLFKPILPMVHYVVLPPCSCNDDAEHLQVEHLPLGGGRARPGLPCLVLALLRQPPGTTARHRYPPNT